MSLRRFEVASSLRIAVASCLVASAGMVWAADPPAAPPDGTAEAAPSPRPAEPTAADAQELWKVIRQLSNRIKSLEARPLPPPPPPPPLPSSDPFSYADWTWLNGNSRQTEFPLDSPAFSGQFMVDANYTYQFARPKDHTLVGSTTSGRTEEFQLSHLGIGGDLHWKNIRGRLMTQFGLYSTMTPRNDSSTSRGQWDLADAYRYLTEAYGGYHLNVLHGINLDIGIFMSYIGLCSYYDFENWVYQESYVSANTPWFFNGGRIQIFPTDRLKVEIWIINGWQSYGMFNEMPGLGWQLLWRPRPWVSFVTNEYFGKDTLGNPDRWRLHSDTSVQFKFFDRPDSFIDRAAMSLTFDAGCENGGGVSCFDGSPMAPTQAFIGFMAYTRFWFWRDRFGLTLGGGAITNPGRYLVLLPPINGATAASGTPYFTLNPGDQFKAWDASATIDWMPSQFITVRAEYIHRQSNVPYFAGSGGVTPDGGNQGAPGSMVQGFTPDLRKSEDRMQFVVMVRL
jgi:putative OmpL-like beta-barrel porin-2